MPRLDRTTVLMIVAIFVAAAAYIDHRGRDSWSVDQPVPARSARAGSGPFGAAPNNEARSPPAQLNQHPLEGLRLGDLGDTIARPLFEPSRRPVIAPSAPLALIPPPPPIVADFATFRLIGTILGEGRATAVVVTQGRPQAVRVEVGDSVDTWTIERISRDEVVLTKNGRRQVLRTARKTN